MVRLPDVGGRKPAQLSGGQRQRVALARAIVNRPRVLLLDEPLGALDLKLREEMQVELKRIQREVGITFVYVTHDQDEALSMSDRLAVFNEGRIEQVGTPAEVYEQPGERVRRRASSASRTSSSATGAGSRSAPRRSGSCAPDDAADGLVVEAGHRRRRRATPARATRYEVALDARRQLIAVTRQNLETSHDEARDLRGRQVRVGWRVEQTFDIGRAVHTPPEERA